MKLRKLRLLKKFGLNEFAKTVNVSPSYLSQIEREEKLNPSKDVMSRIAKALGEEVKDVFF